MTTTTKAQHGFVCPTCSGVRLKVYRTHTPARGLVVRYRECPTCGYREVTKEQKSHTVKPKEVSVH